MKIRLLLFSAVIAFLSCSVMIAQTGTVRGKVTDKKTGEPLSGARVTVVNTQEALEDLLGTGSQKVGRVTNKDGAFEIPNVKPGKYIVQSQYVGYKVAAANVTIDAGGTATVELRVVPDVKGLDEVVVTGVASRTQKAVAEVAVSRINATDLTDRVGYTNAGQLISGKVSGVTITPASGQVGGGLRFNVRAGAGLLGGDPTIFVDGVRYLSDNSTGIGAGGQQVSQLSDLNPADIESMEILKGPAAAALYGSSGQNGVVLIRTKHGRGLEGQNDLRITYQGTFGFNNPHRKITADQMVSYNEANALFRQGSIVQNGINLQGSSGIFNYYAGFEDRQENGFVPQNSLSRQSVRLNLEAVTSKNLTISANTNFTLNKISRPQNDNNIYGWMGNTQIFSPYANPTATIANRTYKTKAAGFGGDGSYQFTDSLAIAAAENNQNVTRFTSSVEISYIPTFVPGLTLRGVVGFDARSVSNDTFFPPNYSYGSTPTGQREIFNFSSNRLNFDLSAAYATKFGEINSNTIVGSQGTNTVNRSAYLGANTFPTELVRDIGAGASATRSVSETFSNTRDAGVFFREELNLEQTYFLSGGFRWDFASTVGLTAPNIFYPQVSGMVRLDKLGVLPDVFNLLKARLAYGQTGSLPGLTDAKAFLWQASSSPYGAGATLNIAGNPAIQPERAVELEMGLDFEIDNAYGAELTYYISNASQSLINLPRPPSTGLGNNPSNVASIQGWGFESQFYARPIQGQEFSLDLNLIFNYADNKVQDLGFAAGGPAFLNSGQNFLIPGQRRSEFMGLRPLAPRFTAAGYYSYTAAAVETDATRNLVGQHPATGPIIDTTGVVRTPTGTIVGFPIASAAPLYSGSFSVDFRFFRDFSIRVLAEYSLGGSVYNQTRQFHANPLYSNYPKYNELVTKLGIFGSGVPATASNAATDRGPAAQVATGRVPGVEVLTPGTPAYQQAAEDFMRLQQNLSTLNASNYVEKADWLRLREVSVTYNATRLMNDLGVGLKKFTLTGTANNLALFTNYTGPEVEINGSPATGRLLASLDFLTQMQAKAFNLIVSVGF